MATPDGERTLGYTSSLLGGGGATALFFTDLTDAIAEERRAAEAQRFAEVGRIAGAMAHELKSPLATVELYANLMRRALVDDPAAVQQLDVIKDQTRLCLDRLGAIMHSINPDAARAGGMVLTPVAPVVRDVVAVMRSRNEGASVTLRVTGNGTRAAIAENDLRSVVTNLVSNALEASGGAGAGQRVGAHRRGRGDDHRGRPRAGAARRRRVRGLLHDQVQRHRPRPLAGAPRGRGRRRQHRRRRPPRRRRRLHREDAAAALRPAAGRPHPPHRGRRAAAPARPPRPSSVAARE